MRHPNGTALYIAIWKDEDIILETGRHHLVELHIYVPTSTFLQINYVMKTSFTLTHLPQDALVNRVNIDSDNGLPPIRRQANI